MLELGKTYRDVITGFEGVAVAVTDWLYGCRRVTLQPRALESGIPVATQTFDEPQLEEVIAEEPVAPAASHKGGPRPEPTRHAGPVR